MKMDQNGDESFVPFDREFDEKEDEKRERERERGKKKKNSLFIFPRAPPVFTSGSKTDTDPHEENSKH